MAKDESIPIKVKTEILADPAEVYSAFTHASGLSEWLCNVAQADGHEGGRVYLWWQNGYYASGEFLSLEEPEKIVFSWHGRNEPGITRVKVSIRGNTQSSEVQITHGDLGKGKVWERTRKEFKRGWKRSLENLKSVLESGVDLRILRQPILGIGVEEELTAQRCAELNLPVSHGLRVGTVYPELGGHQAGLEKGDILVKIAGKKLASRSDYRQALQTLQAGEEIKVVYYRGGEKFSTRVTLSERPMPAIPGTLDGLIEHLKNNYQEGLDQIGKLVEGMTPEEASYKPEPHAWNNLEVLAHLIATERDLSTWITQMLEGLDSSEGLHTIQPMRLAVIVASFSTATNLLAELKRNQAETLALLDGLPGEFAHRKRSFWRLGYNVMQLQSHLSEHCLQMQANCNLWAASQQALESTEKKSSPQRTKKKNPVPEKTEVSP